MLKKTALAVLISGFAIASFAADAPAPTPHVAKAAAKSETPAPDKTKHKQHHHKKGAAQTGAPAATK